VTGPALSTDAEAPCPVGTKNVAAGTAPLASIAGMRAVVVAAGLWGFALAGCGGASDAFVASSGDGGSDATSEAREDGTPGTGAADHGTGDPGTIVRRDPGTDASARGPAAAAGDAGQPPPVDGGPGSASDGGLLDAGAAPDGPAAGRIACGGATCDTSAQFCCAGLDGGAACQTSEQACVAVGGAPRRCEKTADCPAGNVCCYDFSSIPATTSCHSDCNGDNGVRVEACGSQRDCATGTCATHACSSGGAIQACAAFGTECP
jgi:hypothetical protein